MLKYLGDHENVTSLYDVFTVPYVPIIFVLLLLG